MRDLQELNPLPTQAAKQAFDELDRVMKGLQAVRNNVIHAVLMYADGTDAPIFELRSRSRGYTKAQVFETEELTNYAAYAAWVLRHELGDIDSQNTPGQLPNRPLIPEFLQELIPGRNSSTSN